jgi:hypothetical protein
MDGLGTFIWTNYFQIRLRILGSLTLVVDQAGFSSATNYETTVTSSINGIFTLTGFTNIQLELEYFVTTSGGYALGLGGNITGEANVFGMLKFQR